MRSLAFIPHPPAPITWMPNWSTTSKKNIRWSRPPWRPVGRKVPRPIGTPTTPGTRCMDGGPWNPWIPSKRNIHCIASDEADDIGIVAIPHLSRDLMAVFDGPGSYYGTHPQNILRGMVYEDGNFLISKISLTSTARWSNTIAATAYNMMFVGPGWMSKGGRWEVGLCLPAQELQRRHGVLWRTQKAGTSCKT